MNYQKILEIRAKIALEIIELTFEYYRLMDQTVFYWLFEVVKKEYQTIIQCIKQM